jgi:hypothetical protein
MLLINRIFIDIFDNLSGHNSFPMTAHDHPAKRPQDPAPAPKLRAAATPKAKPAQAAQAHRPVFG